MDMWGKEREWRNKNNEDEEKPQRKHENTDERANVQERVNETEFVPSLVGLVCAQFQRVFPLSLAKVQSEDLNRLTYRGRRVFGPQHGRTCRDRSDLWRSSSTQNWSWMDG